ncbi:MAG: EAL domain-containing protein [Magnetococcales bacterium]|nr:EAL domain-containing protein [Magnetococcales bacterium]
MPTQFLILVVDDDAVTRLMICRFLERNGYATKAAEHGREAVEMFQKQSPDLVLMDAKMPLMDGFLACEEIKRLPRSKHTPVMMITGLEDDDSVDRAFAAGATDFITKPIHWAILRNRVKYLLRAVEAERKLHLSDRVFQSTSEGIVVTDAKAVIQSVNPAFSQITGYHSDEAVGRHTRMLKSGNHDLSFYEKMWDALIQSGKWQGEIWNRRKSGELYPQWASFSAIRGPSDEITNYVAVFSDLTAAKESEKTLVHITGHDGLTDLPNRLAFFERTQKFLADARRRQERVGVLMLDLDRFKVVNETMGHNLGDGLLVEVAKRLISVIPDRGLLARMGGDEFGLLCPCVQEPEDMALLAQKVLNILEAPFDIQDMELFIGASIGIGLFPMDGMDVNTLVRNADTAMYHAKEQGRNNFQFYRDKLNTSSMARMILEGSLRSALDRNEFELFYQPQVDIQSGALVGAEALIRWNHPERGMVSPGEFIPMAEETGLILPMGRWALRSACQRAVAWSNEGLPPIRVAVNLSGLQFRQPDFIEIVEREVQRSGLDPQYLELELTESIAMGDVEETFDKLKTLSEMGCQIAIDDFGTGFSSLSYLKRFPIDTLKIDRSFVRNCTEDSEDAAIVKTFIGLAHSLKLRVIAEGVETEPQRLFMVQNSCDEIQGYLYGRPMPAGEFQKMLTEQLHNGGGVHLTP